MPSTTRIPVPAFDLAWLRLSDLSSVLLLVGGGGSAKTGVKNSIQIARVGEKGLEICSKYDTDINGKSCLCSSICCGMIKDVPVVCVAYDKSCALLVADKTDSEDLKFKRVLDFDADFAEGGSVNCCCILPSGHIVTGGDDGVCRVWAIDISVNASWTIVKEAELKNHVGPVMALSYHPTARLLCSGSKDGTCKIWNLASNEMVGDIICLDGISGTGSVIAKQAATSVKLECRGCCFSADGSSIYVIQSARRGQTHLVKWAVMPRSQPKEETTDSDKGARRKKRELKAGADEEIVSIDFDVLDVLSVCSVPSTRLRISDCGRYISVGASDGSVVLVDEESLKKVASYALHDLPVTGLSFAPVSASFVAGVPDLLVSCSADNKLCSITVGGLSLQFKVFYVMLSVSFVILVITLTLFLFFDQEATIVLAAVSKFLPKVLNLPESWNDIKTYL